MAVAHVTLSPYLQAWAFAGVSHILFEQPVQISAVLPAQAPMAAPPARGPVLSAAKAQSAPVEAAPARPAIPQREAQPGVPAAAPLTKSFASRQGVPADPAAWPAPWNQLRGKAAAGPIVWTYHELGADMTGTGHSAERSAFFRQIIADLQLRKGSSSFWPCAIPHATADGSVSFVANPAYFAAGIDFLMPQLVVIFGKQALADIGLDDGSPYFSHLMVEGKLVVVLPEVGDLLQGTAQRASCASLLRAVVNTLRFS